METSALERCHKVRVPHDDSGYSPMEWVVFRALETPLSARFFAQRRAVGSALPVCALCRTPLVSGDDVMLVMTGNLLFPNCFVHLRCTSEHDLSVLACLLRDEWQAAQRYAHWFA